MDYEPDDPLDLTAGVPDTDEGRGVLDERLLFDDAELALPQALILDDAAAPDTAFDAPDLATAFLAALDAVDDVRFVTPPPQTETDTEPAVEPRRPVAGLLTMGEREPCAAIVESAVEAAIEPVLVAAEPAPDPEPEPDAEPEVLEDLQEFVVFSLGDLRCVVPIRSVLEVGRIPESAPVPNAPAWLHGLGNLRGQVLSLIDLRAFFGVGRIKPSTGRMVVLRAESEEITAGVMVDQVHQIVALSPSRFRGAPDELPERSRPFVWGACDYGNYTMIGLDVDGVLGVESLTDEPV